MLARHTLELLMSAAMEVYNGGEMRPAGMGRGGGLWHGSESRGDSILWVTDGIRGEGQLPEVFFLLNLVRYRP